MFFHLFWCFLYFIMSKHFTPCIINWLNKELLSFCSLNYNMQLKLMPLNLLINMCLGLLWMDSHFMRFVPLTIRSMEKYNTATQLHFIDSRALDDPNYLVPCSNVGFKQCQYWSLFNKRMLYLWLQDYENYISYVCKAYKGAAVPKACSGLSFNLIYGEKLIHPVCYEEIPAPTLLSRAISSVMSWIWKMATSM